MLEADANTPPGDAQQQFIIQKVYLKDASLEMPNSPEIFRAEWRPQANVELNTEHRSLDESAYEVVIAATVTTKLDGKTAYLCEVHAAGIFTITGFDGQTLDGLLGSYCPTILFPYAREAISDLTSRAGFPAMVLAPVNFDILYAQKLAGQQQRQASETQ
ncbi:MAG TPA: protein-export chaperone SecB [Nitrococcus sp.]|nr:protein-export chaperone SecB [Nitrococcus sp.]